MRPFNPKAGGTIVIANATSATATQALDRDCPQLSLYNSSATAVAFFRITSFPDNTLGTAVAPTVTTDMPVGPGERVVVTVGRAFNAIRCIASAADGNLYVTQGQGEF